jgi:hypothetical protein
MAQLPETDLISLIMAISSDEKKNARLQEIMDALKAVEAANAKGEELAQEMRDRNAAASRASAQAEARYSAAVAKERVLDERERTLSDHNQALIAEKAAWEKIRQQVDEEQKGKAGAQAKLEEELIRREQDVKTRETMAEGRERTAARLGDIAIAKIERMREALEFVDSPPPGEPKKDAA